MARHVAYMSDDYLERVTRGADPRSLKRLILAQPRTPPGKGKKKKNYEQIRCWLARKVLPVRKEASKRLDGRLQNHGCLWFWSEPVSAAFSVIFWNLPLQFPLLFDPSLAMRVFQAHRFDPC